MAISSTTLEEALAFERALAEAFSGGSLAPIALWGPDLMPEIGMHAKMRGEAIVRLLADPPLFHAAA